MRSVFRSPLERGLQVVLACSLVIPVGPCRHRKVVRVARPARPSAGTSERAVGGGRDSILKEFAGGCGPEVSDPAPEPVDAPVDSDDPQLSLYRAPPKLLRARSIVGDDHTQGLFVYLHEGAVWVSTVDGERRRRVVPPPPKVANVDAGEAVEFHGPPQWANDGRTIVFSTTRGDPRGRVAVIERRCRQVRWIGGPLCAATCPQSTPVVVSPDGQHAAYVADGGSALEVAHIDTGAVRRFAFEGWPTWPPAWSPDGRFVAVRAASGEAIAVFEWSGERRTTLVRPELKDYGAPAFAPSGSLWFGASAEAFMGALATDVWFLPTAADAPAALTESPFRRATAMGVHGWVSELSFAPARAGDFFNVSPGARTKVAFLSAERIGGFGGPWVESIFVASLEAMSVKPLPLSALTELAGAWASPFYGKRELTWGPDGRWLAFRLAYCSGAGCVQRSDKIVVTDGRRYGFVVSGTAPAFGPYRW